jgi:hypothetical protein
MSGVVLPRMKLLSPALRCTVPASFVLLLLGASLLVRADGAKLAPLMSTPGAALTTGTFGDSLPSAWKPGKGTWVTQGGVLRGTELAADEHGAVVRRSVNFKDAIITFSFRLNEARTISLSINDAKGHVCRLIVDPAGFTLRKDINDKRGGTDKAITFARVPMKFAKDVWHTAILELNGPDLVAQIDGAEKVALGTHAFLDRPKSNFGLTVAGGPAEFREISIVEAKRRDDWAATKKRLSAR